MIWINIRIDAMSSVALRYVPVLWIDVGSGVFRILVLEASARRVSFALASDHQFSESTLHLFSIFQYEVHVSFGSAVCMEPLFSLRYV